MGDGRARGDTTLADWAGTWQGTWSIDIHAAADNLVISHTNAPPDGTPAEAVRLVFAR